MIKILDVEQLRCVVRNTYYNIFITRSLSGNEIRNIENQTFACLHSLRYL